MRTGWNDDSIQFSLFPLFIITFFYVIVLVEIDVAYGIAIFFRQAVEFFQLLSLYESGKAERIDEKGAVVSLDEDVEGFATPKHLQKEDGSQAQQGEVLPFKVIEFNKDSKRIILSHSRTFEDPAREEKKAAAKKARTPKKEEAPKIENVAASTTLGDIDVLAQLKSQMEKGE